MYNKPQGTLPEADSSLVALRTSAVKSSRQVLEDFCREVLRVRCGCGSGHSQAVSLAGGLRALYNTHVTNCAAAAAAHYEKSNWLKTDKDMAALIESILVLAVARNAVTNKKNVFVLLFVEGMVLDEWTGFWLGVIQGWALFGLD
ncbi:hypothetical protein BY996DRAFT_6412032 [Phakopsora pachyrhizi]|nr:hypothetical protein BY996DRAFT_6412032 [Phakopsora pachyrhizi]